MKRPRPTSFYPTFSLPHPPLPIDLLDAEPPAKRRKLSTPHSGSHSPQTLSTSASSSTHAPRRPQAPLPPTPSPSSTVLHSVETADIEITRRLRRHAELLRDELVRGTTCGPNPIPPSAPFSSSFESFGLNCTASCSVRCGIRLAGTESAGGGHAAGGGQSNVLACELGCSCEVVLDLSLDQPEASKGPCLLRLGTSDFDLPRFQTCVSVEYTIGQNVIPRVFVFRGDRESAKTSFASSASSMDLDLDTDADTQQQIERNRLLVRFVMQETRLADVVREQPQRDSQSRSSGRRRRTRATTKRERQLPEDCDCQIQSVEVRFALKTHPDLVVPREGSPLQALLGHRRELTQPEIVSEILETFRSEKRIIPPKKSDTNVPIVFCGDDQDLMDLFSGSTHVDLTLVAKTIRRFIDLIPPVCVRIPMESDEESSSRHGAAECLLGYSGKGYVRSVVRLNSPKARFWRRVLLDDVVADADAEEKERELWDEIDMRMRRRSVLKSLAEDPVAAGYDLMVEQARDLRVIDMSSRFLEGDRFTMHERSREWVIEAASRIGDS